MTEPQEGGFEPLPLSKCVLTEHAVKRYRYWRKLLAETRGTTVRFGENHKSLESEIRWLLMFLAPCTGIPPGILMGRLWDYGSQTQFWHAAPYRFVIVPDGERFDVVTIEPDKHIGDLGVWEGVPGVDRYYHYPEHTTAVQQPQVRSR